MNRITRLYQKFYSLEIQKCLIYQPVMTVFSYLAHTAWIATTYIFTTVVTSSFSTTSQLELLLFLSYFHTVKAIFWIPCSVASGFLAGSAFREGKIDFILTKPVPSQWFISNFRPNIYALTDLLVGISSFLYFSSRLGILDYHHIILYGISAPVSALTLYSLWFSYLTFFVPSGDASAAHGLMNLFWVFGEYPNQIYSGFSKIISTIIFPSVIITTLPMSILLGQKGGGWILVLIGVSLFSLIVSTRLWNRMLRFYTSAN